MLSHCCHGQRQRQIEVLTLHKYCLDLTCFQHQCVACTCLRCLGFISRKLFRSYPVALETAKSLWDTSCAATSQPPPPPPLDSHRHIPSQLSSPTNAGIPSSNSGSSVHALNQESTERHPRPQIAEQDPPPPSDDAPMHAIDATRALLQASLSILRGGDRGGDRIRTQVKTETHGQDETESRGQGLKHSVRGGAAPHRASPPRARSRESGRSESRHGTQTGRNMDSRGFSSAENTKESKQHNNGATLREWNEVHLQPNTATQDGYQPTYSYAPSRPVAKRRKHDQDDVTLATSDVSHGHGVSYAHWLADIAREQKNQESIQRPPDLQRDLDAQRDDIQRPPHIAPPHARDSAQPGYPMQHYEHVHRPPEHLANSYSQHGHEQHRKGVPPVHDTREHPHHAHYAQPAYGHAHDRRDIAGVEGVPHRSTSDPSRSRPPVDVTTRPHDYTEHSRPPPTHPGDRDLAHGREAVVLAMPYPVHSEQLPYTQPLLQARHPPQHYHAQPHTLAYDSKSPAGETGYRLSERAVTHGAGVGVANAGVSTGGGGTSRGSVAGGAAGGVAESPAPALPQRPDMAPCSFYVRTGQCKYGATCKWDHPPDRKSKKLVLPRREGQPVRPGAFLTSRAFPMWCAVDKHDCIPMCVDQSDPVPNCLHNARVCNCTRVAGCGDFQKPTHRIMKNTVPVCTF